MGWLQRLYAIMRNLSLRNLIFLIRCIYSFGIIKNRQREISCMRGEVTNEKASFRPLSLISYLLPLIL